VVIGRRLFYAAIGIIVVVSAIGAIGYALPQAHVVSVQGVVPKLPAKVFEQLRDVSRYPDWRTDVKRVEIISSAPLFSDS
jgi:hypothetical protein